MAKAPKTDPQAAATTAPAAATGTPAPADAGTEGAAVVQQTTLQVAAAAPTENARVDDPTPKAPGEKAPERAEAGETPARTDTPPSGDGAQTDQEQKGKPATMAERRAATVASRIDHDGEVYSADGVVMLTETEFLPLSKAGALVETSWDDCRQDE